MAVRFLLDENLEHEVLARLQDRDYVATHVDLESGLGKGVDDTDIADFSLQEEWVIVTYDADFVIEHDESDYFGAVYFDDTQLSASEVCDVLDTMARSYPTSAFEGLEFGGPHWL